MIAHIAGVPLEETLLPLVSGLTAGLLLARSWTEAGLRRMQNRRRSSAR